ncbi:YaiO family outer membrane beta-barrel protein [Massilia sp. IC2-477]|uniref:YaiO family outer membrane beta-barrel protein n=1 Tax=Massilia sp. IC2-477 TaxID=2887198 RepID=UPI001D12596B|nr:YaiO family outer membrane beta-barrel protein [Massilia sp. IC2-477]MCC2956088.1 YaiO family outer membrane beta-barrel protein [Massilia sp. IC2-477]
MPFDYQQPPTETTQVQPAATTSFDEQYAEARRLANAGQPGLALAAYNTLLARAPGNVDLLLGRGIVLSRLERWSEAEADLTAAAKASPDYADVWFALGNLYQWQDLPARAAEAYGRAAVLRPGDAATLAARERALRAMQPRPGTPQAAIASGYTWTAGLSGSWQDVGAGPRWNDQTLSLRHYGKRGSIGFEALRAHRFDQSGRAWAVDAYASLWDGAYANLRYQRAPAGRLFPANSGRVELYQSLGRGWEASLSEDVLGFESRVNIHGVGLGKYAGDFYVQLRHQNIVSDNSRGAGQRLLARWYYAGDSAGDGASYLEMSANRGRSDDPLSLTGGRARSGGGSLTWVHYLSRHWGGKVGARFARSGAGGASEARERGLSVGLYRRW